MPANGGVSRRLEHPWVFTSAFLIYAVSFFFSFQSLKHFRSRSLSFWLLPLDHARSSHHSELCFVFGFLNFFWRFFYKESSFLFLFEMFLPCVYNVQLFILFVNTIYAIFPVFTSTYHLICIASIKKSSLYGHLFRVLSNKRTDGVSVGSIFFLFTFLRRSLPHLPVPWEVRCDRREWSETWSGWCGGGGRSLPWSPHHHKCPYGHIRWQRDR